MLRGYVLNEEVEMSRLDEELEAIHQELKKGGLIRDGHTPPDNKTDKDTNPKDALAANKAPMGLCPDTIKAYASLAWLEGGLKYGRYNWRVAGVSATIYHDALERHIMRWWNGEWADPKTQVPHLASVIACAGIILDAHLLGKLTDDRPPANLELVEFIRNLEPTVIKLKEMFKEHHPHQYTIGDKAK
jgi:hypothetical protein